MARRGRPIKATPDEARPLLDEIKHVTDAIHATQRTLVEQSQTRKKLVQDLKQMGVSNKVIAVACGMKPRYITSAD